MFYYNSVTYPGFPPGGAPTPQVDVKSYYLANFPPKTTWNWKNLDLGGAHSWHSS